MYVLENEHFRQVMLWLLDLLCTFVVWMQRTQNGLPDPITPLSFVRIQGQSYVELESLRVNRSYSVELQAVSYWGQTPLKSPKATLHFNTRHSTSTVNAYQLPNSGNILSSQVFLEIPVGGFTEFSNSIKYLPSILRLEA